MRRPSRLRGPSIFAIFESHPMSSVQAISAISAVFPAKNADAARASEGKRQPPPIFSRPKTDPVRAPSVDRSDEAATFQERVQMLFDAKVPAGGPYSRSYEFDVSGVHGKIMEPGAGMLYVDFPQQGVGMLISGGVCAPTANATAGDIAAMMKATLLGLST